MQVDVNGKFTSTDVSCWAYDGRVLILRENPGVFRGLYYYLYQAHYCYLTLEGLNSSFRSQVVRDEQEVRNGFHLNTNYFGNA